MWARLVFPDPPSRQDFGNAKLFGPGPPLGFELSKDIPNPNLQELARHVLLRVCNVVIAIRKDPHANEPAGSCRSEIACSEGGSSGVRLIKDREGKRMHGPEKRIGTGRTQVAGVFVQEGTCQKLGSVSGRTICQSVSVVPAECASTIFPIVGIFARGIEHSQSHPKSWQDNGWWTEGFMGVYKKFILHDKRSSGQPRRQGLGIDSGVFQSLPATVETGPAPDPAASGHRED
jgi:hypothetical protein